MKNYKYSNNTGSLKSLILQLQLTIEFSQIKEILFVYRDLLVLITNYSFLFEDSSSEIPALIENPVYVETAFFTQDPARDGMNWYAYCSGNPVNFTDPNGLWESKNKWNADYEEQYSNYISPKITQYEKNNELFTCEDLALSLLIDFASENSLPVIIKNSRGIYNSNDKKYDNPADYKKKVLSTTAAGHLLKNTIDINKGDVKPGDIVLMDDGAGNGPNSLDGKPGHTQVIEKNTQGVFNIKQGNFDETKRGKYGSDNYGGINIQARRLDTNTDEFYGSDNVPRPSASQKYGLWYRRWDFNSFNGLDIKSLDVDKMSPRMKHEMQKK